MPNQPVKKPAKDADIFGEMPTKDGIPDPDQVPVGMCVWYQVDSPDSPLHGRRVLLRRTTNQGFVVANLHNQPALVVRKSLGSYGVARPGSKYRRRWRGSDGAWRYKYDDDPSQLRMELPDQPALVVKVDQPVAAAPEALTPGEQALHDLQEWQKQRVRASVVTGWDMPALESALLEHELISRDLHFEVATCVRADGSKVFSKGGSRDTIIFTDEDAERGRGCYMTHNHPSNSSFSPEDVTYMVFQDLAGMRAVGQLYQYSMRVVDPAVARLRLGIELRAAETAVRMELTEKIQAGKMTVHQANAWHFHEVWSRAAPKCGLEYTRVAWADRAQAIDRGQTFRDPDGVMLMLSRGTHKYVTKQWEGDHWVYTYTKQQEEAQRVIRVLTQHVQEAGFDDLEAALAAIHAGGTDARLKRLPPAIYKQIAKRTPQQLDASDPNVRAWHEQTGLLPPDDLHKSHEQDAPAPDVRYSYDDPAGKDRALADLHPVARMRRERMRGKLAAHRAALRPEEHHEQ